MEEEELKDAASGSTAVSCSRRRGWLGGMDGASASAAGLRWHDVVELVWRWGVGGGGGGRVEVVRGGHGCFGERSGNEGKVMGWVVT